MNESQDFHKKAPSVASHLAITYFKSTYKPISTCDVCKDIIELDLLFLLKVLRRM